MKKEKRIFKEYPYLNEMLKVTYQKFNNDLDHYQIASLVLKLKANYPILRTGSHKQNFNSNHYCFVKFKVDNRVRTYGKVGKFYEYIRPIDKVTKGIIENSGNYIGDIKDMWSYHFDITLTDKLLMVDFKDLKPNELNKYTTNKIEFIKWHITRLYCDLLYPNENNYKLTGEVFENVSKCVLDFNEIPNEIQKDINVFKYFTLYNINKVYPNEYCTHLTTFIEANYERFSENTNMFENNEPWHSYWGQFDSSGYSTIDNGHTPYEVYKYRMLLAKLIETEAYNSKL